MFSLSLQWSGGARIVSCIHGVKRTTEFGGVSQQLDVVFINSVVLQFSVQSFVNLVRPQPIRFDSHLLWVVLGTYTDGGDGIARHWSAWLSQVEAPTCHVAFTSRKWVLLGRIWLVHEFLSRPITIQRLACSAHAPDDTLWRWIFMTSLEFSWGGINHK